MSWFSAFQDDHAEVHHRGSYTHDAIAGAAAYEAAKAYEDHLAANGQPVSHAKAKELLAGFAGAAATQLFETKGLDAWDEGKRRQVQEQTETRLNETILVDQYPDSY